MVIKYSLSELSPVQSGSGAEQVLILLLFSLPLCLLSFISTSPFISNLEMTAESSLGQYQYLNLFSRPALDLLESLEIFY